MWKRSENACVVAVCDTSALFMRGIPYDLLHRKLLHVRGIHNVERHATVDY